MTPRERMMALAAMILVFFLGGGVLGYQFFLKPMKVADARLISLKADLAKDEDQLNEIQEAFPLYELRKKMSLPADPVTAKFKYSQELDKMLRDSEFSPAKFSVDEKDVERTLPPGSKKPPFQKLTYNIKASGDESCLVTFLTKFYDAPLMHRIRSITVEKPVTTTGQQRQNELDIKLMIEALIVDGAENRDTLYAKGVTPPKRSARSTSQYASIAGHDIFFGPAPPMRITGDGNEKKTWENVKLEDCIHLAEITLKPDGAEASLYDALNNKDYMVYSDTYGTIETKVYYYLKQTRKLLDWGKDLAVKEGETVLLSYKVVRIDPLQLILESEDNYFSLHVGNTLSELVLLKPEMIKMLGLPVKEKKVKKDARTEKKDDKKVEVEKK